MQRFGENLHFQKMYSTKLLNKNLVDGNAYITVNDLYKDRVVNPFRAPKKGDKVPTPFQVKVSDFHPQRCNTHFASYFQSVFILCRRSNNFQFLVFYSVWYFQMLPVNAENGNFSKLQYAAGGYQEANKYTTTQPLDARKKGFGSHDAKRRDEFANAIRTEQYRSTIAKESVVTAKGSEKLQETLSKIMSERAQTTGSMSLSSSSSSGFNYSSSVPQYDIGRTRVTPFDPKSIKDTYYKFSGGERRLGDYRPTSSEFGDGAWDIQYKPPQFGGRSETKNFLDKSHLNTGH